MMFAVCVKCGGASCDGVTCPGPYQCQWRSATEQVKARDIYEAAEEMARRVDVPLGGSLASGAACEMVIIVQRSDLRPTAVRVQPAMVPKYTAHRPD
jgi:hypothetical protein